MALPYLLCLLVAVSSSFYFANAARIVAYLEPSRSQVSIPLGTPSQKQLLPLDLDALVSVVPCQAKYFQPAKSSTFAPLGCSSKLCTKCHKKSCLFSNANGTSLSIFQDVVTLNTTDNEVATPTKGKISFGCAAEGRLGQAAFSRSKLALPFQVASSYALPQKFIVCSSPDSPSPIFFGDDSNLIVSGINISNYISFVPFESNPVYPFHYYLPLQGIRVEAIDLKLPASLLTIDTKTGIGGIKLSITDRYSTLATPTYAAIAQAFKQYAARFNISIVPPVPPLKLCFNTTNFNYNRLGPAVPDIDFIFGNVTWSLTGSTSIEIRGNVGCLAFLDAGAPPVTSTIGLFQQFDNLLHFDLEKNRFGFVDRSLHIFRQNCGFMTR